MILRTSDKAGYNSFRLDTIHNSLYSTLTLLSSQNGVMLLKDKVTCMLLNYFFRIVILYSFIINHYYYYIHLFHTESNKK